MYQCYMYIYMYMTCNRLLYCEGAVAYIFGKVHFSTVLKEGLYNWKMSLLGGNVEGRPTSLGSEQNAQTMKYSFSECKQFTWSYHCGYNYNNNLLIPSSCTCTCTHTCMYSTSVQ